MSVSFIVGILGNVISILVFASPIKTFWRIAKHRSTESFKWIPYVTTLVSTSLWTYYGLLTVGGLLVVTVNFAGSVLQAAYVILFIIYAPKDIKVSVAKLSTFLNVGFVGTVVLVTFFALHGETRRMVIGFLCAGFTIGMYAAPMTAVRTVVKTKSVEYMPFLLSFFLFLNGGVWTVYAIIVTDYFILVPNAIGVVMGTAQLILYAMYRRKTPATTTSEGEEKIAPDEEQGEEASHNHKQIQMQVYDQKKTTANHHVRLSAMGRREVKSEIFHPHKTKRYSPADY